MYSVASEENDSTEKVSLITENDCDVNMINNEFCMDEQDNGSQQRMANEGSIVDLLVKEPVTNETVLEDSKFPTYLVSANLSSSQSVLDSDHIELLKKNESRCICLNENCHSAYDKLQRALASAMWPSNANNRDKIISNNEANDIAVFSQDKDENVISVKAQTDDLKPCFSKFDNVLSQDDNFVQNQKVSLKIIICLTIKLLQKLFCESESALKVKSSPNCRVKAVAFQSVTRWSSIKPAGIG